MVNKNSTMTVNDYAKLHKQEKELELKEMAILIDDYFQDNKNIYVFFLHNFFVEVEVSEGKIIDILPFIRGYKIDNKELHTLNKRKLFFNLES